MGYKILVWEAVDEAELPIIEKLEDAEKELMSNEMSNPENKYELVTVDEDGFLI